MLRKQIIPTGAHTATIAPGRDPRALHVPTLATVLVTSESPEHPVDHLFDGRDGPGGTRWVASADGEQTLILVFDAPQTIREVALEAEEPNASRTQVITLALSQDGGQTYREILRQEFNFSAPSTTFEREAWSVPAAGVTNLRVTIRPDKGAAPGRATLTALSIR
jgi:hypothetical protein